MIHVDTSFLVDLARETACGEHGPALELLAGLAGEEVGASVLVVSELLAAVEDREVATAERDKIEALVEQLEVACPDEGFAHAHARLTALMDRLGETVSTSDLMIATAALIADVPLVARDAERFERVPGLRVMTYPTKKR